MSCIGRSYVCVFYNIYICVYIEIERDRNVYNDGSEVGRLQLTQ